MRKHLDAYYTPEKAVQHLMENCNVGYPKIWEPCVGTGNISKLFPRCKTMDIDPSVNPDFVGDMSLASSWDACSMHFGYPNFVITNPPFNLALPIVQNAYNFSTYGCAMLLRLSFLEPTISRGKWLSIFPPTKLIVLPRISFTGDGKHDNVTCAWMVWEKNQRGSITVVRKD